MDGIALRLVACLSASFGFSVDDTKGMFEAGAIWLDWIGDGQARHGRGRNALR